MLDGLTLLFGPGLHDDDDFCQRRDDAVPDREPFRSRLHAVSVLADDQTLLTNSRVERAMTARIHDVEAGRDDTDDSLAVLIDNAPRPAGFAGGGP